MLYLASSKVRITSNLPLYFLLLMQYAFNLFSHNSGMEVDSGYNEEEMKMVKETRKIWQDPSVMITATCIRVPIMRAHAESINLEFEQDISEADALAALEKFPGVSIINDRCVVKAAGHRNIMQLVVYAPQCILTGV